MYLEASNALVKSKLPSQSHSRLGTKHVVNALPEAYPRSSFLRMQHRVSLSTWVLGALWHKTPVPNGPGNIHSASEVMDDKAHG